ncbi:hypothetical protein [Hymenobacter chitinivorans]|uniref:Lipocalin-like protein n=1 Tax=Hymenobacter chitinivorans DSM 11115 TaxID=1121954 RepID=A0A2M9BQY5_9BACT|nr:hypothetical protein [Hymenobacter chitinivorans]PJJ60371.1 hypothetical protein CLV45_1797 [Hymenobacter chitinivorans DSM 11115]
MRNTLHRTLWGYLLLLLGSCISACTSHDQREALEGLWSIDSFRVGKQDVTDCLWTSLIHLKSNAGCTFPKDPNGGPCAGLSSAGSGGWTVDEETKKLTIHAKQSPLFAGEYDVTFIDDTLKRMLLVRLTSQNRVITCRKGLFDYEQNRRLMQRIVKPRDIAPVKRPGFLQWDK